jgi:hypothetical protein
MILTSLRALQLDIAITDPDGFFITSFADLQHLLSKVSGQSRFLPALHP